MKSPQALVDPSVLKWARKSARVSVEEVALRLKLSSDRIEAWERGSARPTISQLRKLADAYRRPLAVFFLSEPPRDFEALRDFRRLANEEAPDVSDALTLELRRAQELRDAALSLLPDDAEPSAPDLSITLRDDPERAASALRAQLAVENEVQLSWRNAYTALKAWRSAVEELGILVVNMGGINLSEARGFSIVHAPLPLIGLNAKDRPNGRIFTLLHELAHIALHDGGICEWTREGRLVPQSRRIEAFCNSVAAAVLLPRSLVMSIVDQQALPPRDAWPDELVRGLAREASVSEETFLRRLVTLQLVSPEFYARKRSEYVKRYAAAAPGKPIVTYEKRIVGSLGSAYLELAFSAYYDKRITLSDLSSYTGVRVNNLSRIEQEAFGISRVPGTER